MAKTLLRGALLSALLVDVANQHKSARAEALSKLVPPDRLAPVLDLTKLPSHTEDGRPISDRAGHHMVNVLRKRIARGEIPPPPEISLATLFRVSGKLADLNLGQVGVFAGLAYIERETDTSSPHIRSICRYLAEHGHALNLPRSSTEDRMIAGATTPQTDTRTTIRLVFPITCEMAERLSEEEVLDLIALGDRKPKVEVGISASPVSPSPPPPPPPPPEREERSIAPELRVLVHPLDALFRMTGHRVPIVFAANEAHDAGLEDLTEAAEAILEMVGKLAQEARAEDAMGERGKRPPGKVVAARLIRFFEGRAARLASGADVYARRDEARRLEAHHATTLSPEQRERRGLHEPAAQHDAPPRRSTAASSAPLTGNDRAILHVKTKIATLGARALFATSKEKPALTEEQTRLQSELTRLEAAAATKPPE